MSEKEELLALRRLAELETRATPQQPQAPKNYKGEGVVMGATDPIYGIGQVMPRVLSKVTSAGGLFPNPVSRAYDRSAQTVDRSVKAREQSYLAGREDDGFDWGRLTGNVISPVNLMGAGAAAKGAQAATLGGRALSGAVSGGLTSVAMPVTEEGDFATQKAKQALWGAAGGAAVPAIGAAAGRVLNPQTDDAVKGLLNEGVKLTPGEMAGGVAKTMEDKLTSVPLVGDVIKGAQKRSIESLNTAAINRALEPLGKSLPKDVKLGRDAIQFVGDELGKAYDDLLPKLTGQIDQQFSDDLDNLTQMVDADFIMDDAAKAKFKQIMDGLVRNRISKPGGITGQAIKDIESQLNNLTSTFGKSLDPSQKQMASVLSEVQDSLRGMVQRSNPQQAEKLKAINRGYANFKRVQRAASMVGTDEGVFTPSQLQNAVKAMDRSKDKAAFAKGNALMQDLTDPAKSRMASSIPDSGSAGRLMAPAALFGLGTGAVAMPSMSPAMIPAAAMAAGYVPGGRRLAQALLTERPQSVRAVGTAAAKYAPYLGAPLVAPLATQ